ncbi:toxin-activating lysine-acyltransferase [Rhizobium setariae]|uniref:toxin-activating lysine-acyltransferase n=1 Tax=Rhizobium setariae TaxID=2801340 RepID=UPI001FEF4047|nr:toxin-activating lysine-acyltransferase [Rhizobium setariae]
MTEASQLPSSEVIAKVAEVRAKVQSTFGQVVLAMAAVARYRHMMLSELQQLVIDPLIKDRIVIAFPASPDKDVTAAAAPATIAIWASVSEEADKRIREQISAGVFPVRLRAEDWVSGEHVWLLDVIAPSEKMATEVLKSFRRVAKKNEINIHPVVRELVDQQALGQLGRPLRSNT